MHNDDGIEATCDIIATVSLQATHPGVESSAVNQFLFLKETQEKAETSSRLFPLCNEVDMPPTPEDLNNICSKILARCNDVVSALR
jgi:hypothetical protein